MSASPGAFACAAESCLGVPYRLYGRNPQFGLDCVGLIAHCLSQSGSVVPPIPPYRLRNAQYNCVTTFAEQMGFTRAENGLRRGDWVCAVPGPGQLHMLIAISQTCCVHAHASLRKIVSTDSPLPWPVTHHFRLFERD